MAQSLDTVIAAFHLRVVKRQYRFLIFDEVVLKRKTGAGPVKQVVFMVLGITEEGRKEVIDFSIAPEESQRVWKGFLTDLYRDLTEEGVELMVTNGRTGLLAVLPMVYLSIPLQHCWTRRSRNVLNYVRKADHEAVKADLQKIQYATRITKVQRTIGGFAQGRHHAYPKAVACLCADEEQLMSFFRIKDSK